MDRKIALDNVISFRSANSWSHGQSTRKANQLRKEAQARAYELALEMGIHLRICPNCKDGKE